MLSDRRGNAFYGPRHSRRLRESIAAIAATYKRCPRVGWGRKRFIAAFLLFARPAQTILQSKMGKCGCVQGGFATHLQS